MKIGIVGATGEVGRMMLKTLEERRGHIESLSLFASKKSSGEKFVFRGSKLIVQELTSERMKERYDYLLFSAGSQVSKEYAPIAESVGSTVIDNSSAFRRTHPLIVPEVNGNLLEHHRGGIIANPNCSTIQLVLPLYPLHQLYTLQELIISTYQAVSGAGQKGIYTLMAERAGKQIDSPFPRRIDLNVIPQIGEFDENGDCEEEQKMKFEIKKIMNRSSLIVEVTTVRVPVVNGHSESVFARFEQPIDLQEIAFKLNALPHLVYQERDFITPFELGDSEKSYVCRMRQGVDSKTVMFWNVAHNVRLGAASNAINIMQKLIEYRQNGQQIVV